MHTNVTVNIRKMATTAATAAGSAIKTQWHGVTK